MCVNKDAEIAENLEQQLRAAQNEAAALRLERDSLTREIVGFYWVSRLRGS